MSERLHPDADQLNAFVEQALPAHEREQTLAHLAECAACRQVVALSLPPRTQPEVARAPWYFGNWYSGWRLAWAGVPALAVIIVLLIFLRAGRVPTPTVTEMDTARVVTPAEPAAPSPPSAVVPNLPPNQRRYHLSRAPSASDESNVTSGLLSGVAGRASGSSAVANHTDEFLSANQALPSHLAPLSTVSHGSRRLAIDIANHVFLQCGRGSPLAAGGLHNWQGRAVSVALIGQSRSSAPTHALRSPMAPSGAASISGAVTDPTGTAITGATVTSTDVHESVAQAVTDGRGHFRLEHLAPGGYRIEAEAPGFIKHALTAEIAGEQQAVVNLTLSLAAARRR